VQRGEQETRTENSVGMDGDDGPTVPPSDSGRGITMYGWYASKSVDLADGTRERRSR
jgi:hypothetical protein